jgi:Domain of unknown function (DUF4145)
VDAARCHHVGVDASKFRGMIRNQPWHMVQPVPPAEWDCGYCGSHVGSDKGWHIAPNSGTAPLHIRICSNCLGPTFFLQNDGEYSPAPLPGREVENVPSELAALFHEARASAGAGASTAAVLTCRKILMHLAVEEGAQPNLTFVAYVDFLQKNHFAPPKSDAWVDYIRQLGNEANHEIKLMTPRDAQVVIKFVEMLLQFLYEAQGMLAGPAVP